MRTETITRSLYQFHELSEKAKASAREWFRDGIAGEYSWTDESLYSIKTFCAAFDAKLTGWEICPYTYYTFKTDATAENFRGRKLRDFDRGAMPTGYCLDCELWQTFHDEFKRTGDAKRAFNEALEAAFKAWREDMEYQLSDEAIDESISINEYEFSETGERI